MGGFVLNYHRLGKHYFFLKMPCGAVLPPTRFLPFAPAGGSRAPLPIFFLPQGRAGRHAGIPLAAGAGPCPIRQGLSLAFSFGGQSGGSRKR